RVPASKWGQTVGELAIRATALSTSRTNASAARRLSPKYRSKASSISRRASGVNSTWVPLTQPRQEPISDLLPRGRRHFPCFQRSHPSSNFLTPRRLDILFRCRLQALQQGTRDLSPFIVG